MHSRRPPSLRHKGNRRQQQQKRKQQQDDPANPVATLTDSNGNSNSSGNSNLTNTRKKKKLGICSPRSLLLAVTLLAFVLYGKFVLSSASIIDSSRQKESGIRGGGGQLMNNQGDHSGVSQDIGATKQVKEGTAKLDEEKDPAPVPSDKNEPDEEEEWKNLVKEQTTREEAGNMKGV